ncbi:MAG: DUF5658 family protein [Planctomycetota bacterium]|nr:DUF5658 family protein [Planctomycetota bacterium]
MPRLRHFVLSLTIAIGWSVEAAECTPMVDASAGNVAAGTTLSSLDRPRSSDSVFHVADGSLAKSGMPLNSGAVVIAGRLLASPFVISRENGDVLINGEIVARFGRNVSPENQRMKRLAVSLERRLLIDESVLVFGQNVITFSDESSALEVLRTLSTTESPAVRVTTIMSSELEGIETVTSDEWQAVFASFQPDDNLSQAISNHFESFEEENESTTWQATVDTSSQVMYGLSVVGMLLVAFSSGTLLRSPPRVAIRWSEIVPSAESPGAIQRCLFFIAAYSVFDLVATLLAVKTGQFEELNPLGAGLILAPAALAFFKIFATSLGTGLLWRLKDYHGAQVASWWLCMILTLVTVRWVTVQSLFFV